VAVIGLARGPGSFTGVRSGMAFAKGLGFALGIPLQAVGTLEALALQAGEGLVCPLLDARRSQLYWGLYRVGPTSIEPVAPPQVSSPDQVAEELAKWPEPITLLGEPLGWIPFPGCRQASRAAWVLRTASVGTLAWRTFLAGKGQPAGQVTPLYLRSPI
jgi:tRNA threonylcarbamoyladenosine biosynthesis protein TsaB